MGDQIHAHLTETTAGKGDELLKKSLDRVFTQYSKTPHSEDLIFSQGFTSNDRTLINNEGQKWGLRWSSLGFGTNSNRNQLFGLSHHRTLLELVDFVRANGGETIRYKLVEAKDAEKSEFYFFF